MPKVSESLLVPFVVGEFEETFTERFIQRMEPWNTAAAIKGERPLETFCNATSKPFETILEACEEEGEQGEAGWVPAWGKLFNVEECGKKYLPYLGMYVGVQVPKVATEAEARTLVKEPSGLNRGTKKSMEMEIERVLGEKNFKVEERTNSVPEEKAYFFLVYVKAGKITAALYEAINSTKPAGLFYEIIELSGIWLGGEKEWQEIPEAAKWSTIVEGEYLHAEFSMSWEPWQAHYHVEED